jgi:hypothetical protein
MFHEALVRYVWMKRHTEWLCKAALLKFVRVCIMVDKTMSYYFGNAILTDGGLRKDVKERHVNK